MIWFFEKKVDAVFTVEATFVSLITFAVLLAIMFGGLYIHDRVVLQSETNEWSAEYVDCAVDRTSFCNGLKESLKKKLYITTVIGVDTKKQITEHEFTVKYKVNTSFELMKRLFSAGRTQSYVICKSIDRAMQYKWDYDIAKEK